MGESDRVIRCPLYGGEVYQEPDPFVKITNPALRQDLLMMRSQLTRRINEAVGASIITDVHIY